MKYTLVWKRSAFNDLATLWLDAPSEQRARIRQAVDELERELSRDPINIGESRQGLVRIVIAPPVALHFEVFPDDRIVRVRSIGLIQ